MISKDSISQRGENVIFPLLVVCMAVTDTCMMHSSAGIDRILLDLMLRSTVSFKSAANFTAFLPHLIQDWRYSVYSVKDFLVKHNMAK